MPKQPTDKIITNFTGQYTMKYIVVALFLLSTFTTAAQSNLRIKKIILTNDTIKLDTLSIIPNSFRINDFSIHDTTYTIDWYKSLLIIRPNCFTDELMNYSLMVTYRVYPVNFNQTYAHKSKNKFEPDKKRNIDVFKYIGTPPGNDIFDTEGLNKTGSVSRGINFGNNQNLSVNSSLNLQLSGKIKDDINILASISDDNIPIQPDGNTAQLQDFDQVFIKVYTQKTSLIAGDFWMKRPQGYFLNYNKRVQGIQLTQQVTKFNKLKYSFDVGGALSKGKFSRNVFNGIEGNQGPYKLKGAENEPFIIVLAGTEMVYIDGQLLQRGLENDYTVDYNTAEITFTPKRLITKDRRIIVEFQYSDKNYARSIITSSHFFELQKSKVWFNIYSEQDSKNQPLQQTLNDDDKRIMASVGDSTNEAYNFSIDSVAFNANQLLYKKTDSLGYDSVFVYSTNADSAYYKLQFSNVGTGNGNYISSTFTALGRIYKWVAPDTIAGIIIKKGNYEPIILLVTPKKRQMITAGWEYKPNKTSKLYIEGAFSDNDVNQFSKAQKANDDGYALKLGGEKVFRLRDTINPLELVTNVNAEMITQTFNRIERFRPVEFERNWNVTNSMLNNDQLQADVGLTLRKKNYGSIGINGNSFLIKNDYTGLMSKLTGQYKRNGWNLNGTGSYLQTDGLRGTSFLRHNTQLSKTIKRFMVGFNDIHELNKFYSVPKKDSTIAGSYRFYDWEAYAGTSDTLGNRFTINYRQRTDWLNDTGKIAKAALGQQYGATAAFLKNPKNLLRIRAGYRTLKIIDSTLATQKGDNTIVGRIEHDLHLWKNFFTSSLFYEVSSGLELKREFIYIEVPAGQGTYTWIDYNSNGVKELSEFEIAAFPDQATYIRSFTPTNTYIRTYNNQFSQNISLNPAYIIKSKKGLKKLFAKFTDQAFYRVERKTSNDIPELAFNPFRREVADTSLQSLSSSLRNILFFNRSSSIFAADYTIQENSSKSLLSNGFELRKLSTQEIKTRISIKRVLTLTTLYKNGQKLSSSDFLNGRNYKIDFYEIKPELAWQPGTNFRWSVNYSYLYKQNKLEGGGERTINNTYGTEIRFSTAEKGSILANFNYVLIDYNGASNTALSFEMLDALRNGKNYTWSASWQQSLTKNLQLNLTYVGRKSENNRIINTGGVQVRAFF